MNRLMLAVVVTIATSFGSAIAGEPTSRDIGFRMFAELKSYQELDFISVTKRYLGSLEYRECNEIIECGLAHVAMLILAQPTVTFEPLNEKLDDLAINGETPAIRYKAYLARMVNEQPDLFVYEKYGDYKNGDELFTALGQRLLKEALAAK
jgi:hypothetical protein